MSSPNSLPISHESQSLPEQPGPYRIGEIIAYEGMEDERWVVAGYYPNIIKGSRLRTQQWGLYDDEGRNRFGGRDSNMAYPSPISTGQLLTAAEFVRLAVQSVAGEDIDDLQTLRWERFSAKILVSSVEQFTADKIARGEEVTETELAIDHARRIRQADPNGDQILNQALTNGTHDLSPYLEAISV